MSGYQPSGSQPQPHNPFGQSAQNPPGGHHDQLPQFPIRQANGRKLGCVVITLAIVGACVAICCGGFIYLAGSWDSNEAGTLVAETGDERQERFVAGFAGDPQIDQHPDIAGINDLIKKLQSTTAAGDISDVIDIDLLYREMIATKKMSPRPFGRRLFMKSIVEQTQLVREFTEFNIASIVAVEGRPDEAIVMVHLGDTDSTWREELYVVRRGDSWKIYDWGEVGTDVRGSLELAVINGDSSPSKYRQYNRFFTNIDKATNSDDIEESEKLLKGINPDLSYRELRDSSWAALSSYWIGMQRPEEALKCLEHLSDDESPPDGVLYRGMCAYQQGDYQRSIELFNRYEQLTGSSINAKVWRVDACQMLDNNSRILGEYQAILKIMPNHSCINDCARYTVDPAEIEMLVAAIRRTRQPLETAEQIAVSFHQYESYAGVQRLSRLAKELNQGSATNEFLRGLLLDLKGDFAAACESIQKAQKLAANEQSEDRYEYSLTGMYLSEGRELQFYQQAQDKVAAFEEIYWSWADDGEVDADTVTQIAKLHLKTNPDDESAKEIVLQQMIASGQYEQIIAAHADISSDDENFWIVAEAFVQSGKELEALDKIEPFEQTFVQVSRLLREAKAFDRLSAVMKKHSDALNPQIMKQAVIDGKTSFYLAKVQSEAAILRNENRFQEAAFKLLESKVENDENSRWMYGSIASACLKSIREAGISAKDWLIYGDDEYKIRNPQTTAPSENGISWTDFESAFNNLYWKNDHDSADAMLNIFAQWQQTRPEMTMLRAKLLIDTDRSSEAGELLSDAWLTKIKVLANSRESSQPERRGQQFGQLYDRPDSSVETAYSLISKTARLNGDHRRALKYGELLEKEFESPAARLQAACVAGDKELVAKMLKEGSAGVWSLRYETDVVKAFASPKFASVHKEYPESWSTRLFEDYTVFLFENPVAVQADSIKEFIDGKFDSVFWLPEPGKTGNAADRSLMFQAGSLLGKVSIGTTPLKLNEQEILSTAETNLLNNPARWVAVELHSDQSHPKFDEADSEASRRAIESYFPQFKPSAILINWQAILDGDDIEQFFDANFDIKQIHEMASVHDVWLDESEPQNRLSPVEIAGLNKAALELKDKEPGRIKLEVAVDSIGGSDSCRMRVYQIKRGNYGQLNFYAELIDENPAVEFVRGKQMYFEVGPAAITSWSVE